MKGQVELLLRKIKAFSRTFLFYFEKPAIQFRMN